MFESNTYSVANIFDVTLRVRRQLPSCALHASRNRAYDVTRQQTVDCIVVRACDCSFALGLVVRQVTCSTWCQGCQHRTCPSCARWLQ